MASLRLSLLGDNIQKSRMPKLLAVLCDRAGLELAFGLSDAALDAYDFDARADACHDAGNTGIIVTHPFKIRAATRADALRDVPPSLGAANAIRFAPEGWIATNTDYTGFLKAWSALDTAPGKVAMAGAGGVARALAFALMHLGATRLTIFDPKPGRATAVAAACDPTGKVARAVDTDAFRAAVAGADGLVNATPLGRRRTPARRSRRTRSGRSAGPSTRSIRPSRRPSCRPPATPASRA